MKHIGLAFFLLLTATTLGQTKVSSYSWNGRTYTKVLCKNGSTVEVNGVVGERDADVLNKAEALSALPKAMPAVRTSLDEYTDAELLAEVHKRGLKVGNPEVIK